MSLNKLVSSAVNGRGAELKKTVCCHGSRTYGPTLQRSTSYRTWTAVCEAHAVPLTPHQISKMCQPINKKLLIAFNLHTLKSKFV